MKKGENMDDVQKLKDDIIRIKDEAEKQKIKGESTIANLLMEKSRLQKDLKTATLKRGLYQAVVEELQSLVSPVDPLPDARKSTKVKKVEEHLVMHLSDEHADEVVEPSEVGGIEHYDFPIALCRAETYVDTVIKFTQECLNNYTFPTLHIFSYGDHTSGQIHGNEERSYYRNLMKSSLAIGQMQALMIRDLAPYFQQVNVVCVPGNHGRRTVKKNYSENGPFDNWDYLISKIAELHCKQIKNVKFLIPPSFSVNYKIGEHTFCIFHGDEILSWNSIPFYGIERKTRRLVALHHSTSEKVNYFVMGHFHSCSSMSDLKGETFINGAWIGTDSYSYNRFSGYREPMQLIHGVNDKHGVTWRLPVKLKDIEAEKIGPKRYGAILETVK